MSEFIPYTYLVRLKDTENYYYGVQFSENANPANLGKTYFTSSKTINWWVDTLGLNFVEFEVRKTFPNDPDAAIRWEHKVLQQIKAGKFKSMHFVNENYSKASDVECCRRGGYKTSQLLAQRGFYKSKAWNKKHTIWVTNGKKNKRIPRKGYTLFLKSNIGWRKGITDGLGAHQDLKTNFSQPSTLKRSQVSVLL